MSKHVTLDMSQEQTIRLIQRYGEQRLLWDKKHPKHLNIEHRRECWAKIATEYKWPTAVLKKKIASLLGSHRRELHRERKSRIRAAVTGTKFYTSNWFGYPYFEFLRKSKNSSLDKTRQTKPKKKGSKLPDGTSDEDTDASMSEAQDSQPTEEVERVMITTPQQPEKTHTSPEPAKEESESEYEEENTLVTQSHDYLQNTARYANDPYKIFGNYIASELRKYDPRTLACVKHAINNVIFKADLGNIPAKNSDQLAHLPSQSSPSFGSSKLIMKFSPAPSDSSNS